MPSLRACDSTKLHEPHNWEDQSPLPFGHRSYHQCLGIAQIVEAGGRPRRPVLEEVAEERSRQNAKWGEQNHPEGTGPATQPLYGPGVIGEWSRADILADVFTKRTDERFSGVGRPGTWADILLEEIFEALAAALCFRFDADSRGIIPVMTPGRAADGAATEYYWSLLYPTKVAGIYLRPGDSFWGDGIEYALTTGSGFKLVGGFWERDYAEELAVKLAEAAPGHDWFNTTSHALTPELREKFAAIAREHGTWRKSE